MCAISRTRLKTKVCIDQCWQPKERERETTEIQIRSFMVFNDQFWLFIPSIATTNKLRTFVTDFRNLYNHFENKAHTHTRTQHNNKKSNGNLTARLKWNELNSNKRIETMNFTYGHLEHKYLSVYLYASVLQ